MSDQNQTEKQANPFLPIALVAISIIAFLGPTASDASRIKTDLTTYKANLATAQAQAADGLMKSKPIMDRFQKMMMELIELAKTDKDAKQVQDKYGIGLQQQQQQQQPQR